MLLVKLLSTMTVSAMCLILNNRHGIRRCQKRCYELWGCRSVEFNSSLLRIMCMRGMENTEQISALEPSLQRNNNGTRICCRTCQKTEVCVGKRKKNCMSVGKRSPGSSIKNAGNMCAAGSFEQIRQHGVVQGDGNIRVQPHFLRRDLTTTALFTLPKTDIFYWIVDIVYHSYHSSSGRYTIMTSNILKDEKVTNTSMRVVIIEYPIAMIVDGKKLKRETRPARLRSRLVLLYKRENKRLVIITYDRSEANVKKSSVHRFVLDAPDIISADNGDFLVKQQFKVFKQKTSFPESVYIFLRKLEMSGLPQNVIKEINNFKGAI